MSDLDLASLLASRLCHDVVGPVGAIQNGLELIAEDASMTEDALALITRSARQASAKLQFARMAYGAAGGAEALDPGEAGRLTAALFEDERASLDWRFDGAPSPRVPVKLAMLLATYAAGAVPRGGAVAVAHEAGTVTVTATGEVVRAPAFLDTIEAGGPPSDPRAAQALIIHSLAASVGRKVIVTVDDSRLSLTTPLA